MAYLVTKTISEQELKDYKNYINFLFINEKGEYNICKTEQEIIDSNKWTKWNRPLNSIIVSKDKIEIGDKILAVCNNQDLNGKTFMYLGLKEGAEGIIELEDSLENILMSTINLLETSYKVVRKTTLSDREKVITRLIQNFNI